MCGICGIYHFGADRPVDPDALDAMTLSIAHRGPDDEGVQIFGSLGLGFRRLSILDLSPAGHQPMSDPEQRVWVVFNGEIYNFPELRRELEAAGARFRSTCDTEVIVQGYLHWGIDVLRRCNGMFGLAIWDVAARKLTLARDAMGIKPLYYRIQNGTLYFGSEIRAITTGTRERPAPDPVATNLFLRYRYTPAPLTIFKDIRKLAPGEMLTVADGTWTLYRWYDFRPRPFSPMPSAEAAAEALLDIYRRATKRHLLSDVPVGLLLSGGIDSGLLLGLMSEDGTTRPTFTVGYGTAFKDDELIDAAETARWFNAPNAAVLLDRGEFERALPQVVSILEEPVAASSIVPMYFVAQRARRDVKVALMGQGPDELFGGYKRHLGVQYGGTFRTLPAWLRTALAAGIARLPRVEALKRATYALAVEDRLQRYQHIFSLLPAATVDSLFQDGMLTAHPGATAMQCWAPLRSAFAELDELNGFQLVELRSSLPDELLMYGDKLSMVHGLEVRVPYLDREVVEYAQRLGSAFKVRYGVRKWLHRRVCRNFLPASILHRKKRGFAVNVVDAWFRSSLQSRITDYLTDSQSLLYSHLRHTAVNTLLQRHARGQDDNHKILFSLVMLEEWLRSSTTLSTPIPVRSRPGRTLAV